MEENSLIIIYIYLYTYMHHNATAPCTSSDLTSPDKEKKNKSCTEVHGQQKTKKYKS